MVNRLRTVVEAYYAITLKPYRKLVKKKRERERLEDVMTSSREI
jgi:hypothetical protein